MSVNKNFRITIVKLNNKVLVGRWILTESIVMVNFFPLVLKESFFTVNFFMTNG